jgi:PBSX family phage terminase large subunit
MIPYAPLTKRQTEYILKVQNNWLSIAEGGKRASKNVINLIAWAIKLETHPDKIHLAGGVSLSTTKMNIIDSNGFGLEHIFKGRCRTGQYKDRDALYIQCKAGEKIVIIAGGAKENDAARIKGFSIGSAYISEANECCATFIKEVFDRTLASNDRCLIFDLNPKPPRHWFYTDIADFHEEQQKTNPKYGYNYGHFTVADNLSITDSQLRVLMATYDRDSQWFKRDILGQRTAATGRIYTGYRYKDIAVTKDWIRDQKIIDFTIGVDVGGTDATVATLNGFTAGYEHVIMIDGYYHKQGIESGKDHAAYASDIVQFIKPWTLVYPQIANSTIFAESADKLFRQALRTALDKSGFYGIKIVPSYKKDGIVDRINLQNILINQGRKKIANHLSKWFEAYENALWDSDEYADKEWVRVDDGSYPVDCLDSDEYSIQPFKQHLLR